MDVLLKSRKQNRLTAQLVDGPPAAGPDDPAWEKVATNYYPLVGQVIEEPRSLFTPMIVGVEMQALHNGKEIAFRMAWDDRTESKPGGSGETETLSTPWRCNFPQNCWKARSDPIS